MNAIIYRIITAFTAVICAFASLFGIEAAEKPVARQYEIPGEESCYIGNGKVAIHDPSVVESEDGTYYIFGTHGAVAKSDDLITFRNVTSGVKDSNKMLVPDGKTLREALELPLSWTDGYQELFNYDESNWQTNVWAPDVIYNEAMGKYCYYASSSVWGTPHSVIWFATSDSIEGPYENIKCIVYSGFDKIVTKSVIPSYPTHYSFTNIDALLKKGVFSYKEVQNAQWFNETGHYDATVFPNCIDPTVFYDKDGNLHMVYGSYYGGIYIMPLDEETGEPDYKKMQNTDGYDFYFGKRLSITTEFNEWTGEGPYIVYDKVSDYYYLNISYGGLNSLGGYNIREYRSKTVDGPYIDDAGNGALDYKNTGTKLFGNYKFDCLDNAYLASGHGSCLVTDEGKMFQVYHVRLNEGHEGYQTRVHLMARTESGRPVMLPFEYSGETLGEKSIPAERLIGEYEFINHGKVTNGCSDWADAENIISPMQSIKLNADGTISNLKVYESTKENTAVLQKQVSGNWKLKNGTPYVTFIIDGITYEGVFAIQNDEAEPKQERIVFTAVGSNNECIWGVKK